MKRERRISVVILASVGTKRMRICQSPRIAPVVMWIENVGRPSINDHLCVRECVRVGLDCWCWYATTYGTGIDEDLGVVVLHMRT